MLPLRSRSFLERRQPPAADGDAAPKLAQRSHARHTALLPTPASVFDDKARYGYLREAFSTLRYPIICAYPLQNSFLITLINLINVLIREITNRTSAYYWISERGVCFTEISTVPGIVPGRCGGRVQCVGARLSGQRILTFWPCARAHCSSYRAVALEHGYGNFQTEATRRTTRVATPGGHELDLRPRAVRLLCLHFAERSDATTLTSTRGGGELEGAPSKQNKGALARPSYTRGVWGERVSVPPREICVVATKRFRSLSLHERSSIPTPPRCEHL